MNTQGGNKRSGANVSTYSRNRIVINLRTEVEADEALKNELQACITEADWTPPGWEQPISDLAGFYSFLNELLDMTPIESTFGNFFRGLFYIASQRNNALQQDPRYAKFQQWMTLYVEIYGSILNTAESANDLYAFISDPTFSMENFEVTPGGFNSFNAFFSRHMKPGKRPIGTKTYPYPPPSDGTPIAPNPPEDPNRIHENMCNDRIITVPADSVYIGCWPISSHSTVTVSKGNTYSIAELLKGSRYRDRFSNGIFTHSYLTVYTYHRYHVPVRGTILEARTIAGSVYANVTKGANGQLSASDGTGYQFTQERGLLVLDSPVGLVALLPIGMDCVSSCNFSIDVGDYLNKGDEFGYFLFGGSDMIMVFERSDIHIQLPQVNMFYKLGQVFGKA